MIANEKQLEITRGQIRRFQHAVDQHPDEPPKDVDPIIHQAHLDAAISELEVLSQQESLFLQWKEFMKGEWIQDIPQREGRYAVVGRDETDGHLRGRSGHWNTRVIYKHPETRVFTAHPHWDGWFWSVPFPGLPVPPSWIE